MRKFCKSRGIIPSQESAVEKPLKCSLWPSEKKSGVLRDLLLEKKEKKTNNSINSGLLGATFLLFRFPSVFLRCCITQYCGKLCMFIAQIRQVAQ